MFAVITTVGVPTCQPSPRGSPSAELVNIRAYSSLKSSSSLLPAPQDFHSGKTPLHIAVERCSLTDVQFLTETCQVDLDRPTYASCTPLHIAAGRGSIAIVAYLLSMGGNPDLETDEGDTALDLAGSNQVSTLRRDCFGSGGYRDCYGSGQWYTVQGLSWFRGPGGDCDMVQWGLVGIVIWFRGW